MAHRLDDAELPDLPPLPQPRGWFELFCCGTAMLVLVTGLVLLAVLQR